MQPPVSNILRQLEDYYDCQLVTVIATSINHPKSQNTKPLQLSTLKKKAWIIREEGSGTRYAAENIFKQKPFSPNVGMIISDNEAVKQSYLRISELTTT